LFSVSNHSISNAYGECFNDHCKQIKNDDTTPHVNIGMISSIAISKEISFKNIPFKRNNTKATSMPYCCVEEMDGINKQSPTIDTINK